MLNRLIRAAFVTKKVGRWKTLLESGVGSQNLRTDQTVAKLLQKGCLPTMHGAGGKENQRRFEYFWRI